jgi:hypothetical protein
MLNLEPCQHVVEDSARICCGTSVKGRFGS